MVHKVYFMHQNYKDIIKYDLLVIIDIMQLKFQRLLYHITIYNAIYILAKKVCYSCHILKVQM